MRAFFMHRNLVELNLFGINHFYYWIDEAIGG